MLNTKYVIGADSVGQAIAQTNPNALGNAWFVKNIMLAAQADEALIDIEKFNPDSTAIIEKQDQPLLAGFKPAADQVGVIYLQHYEPNHLTYGSNSNRSALAVFSEIYYRGNQDWKAYVDGKEVKHVRADYVLRAMVVPAGKHKIEFKFKPYSVEMGTKLDAAGSILLLLFVGFGFLMAFKK
jgi:hypothetical protein